MARRSMTCRLCSCMFADARLKSMLEKAQMILYRITSSELYRDGQIVFTSTGQVMGTYEYQARKNWWQSRPT